MRPFFAELSVAFVLVALLSSGCEKEGGLPVIRVGVGEHKLSAEVARSDAERARGLMYRRELGRDRGMLFAYDHDEVISFWMQNTFIPLSIAFLAKDGTIVHITDMEPQTTTAHSSLRPCRYALEVNQGWFKTHGIEVGTQVDFVLPAHRRTER